MLWFPVEDLGGDDVARQHAVGESIAGVASHSDPGVLRPWVPSNKGHVVHRLVDLSGPCVLDGRGLGEALAGPGFELLEAAGGGFLADFVVAAADDQVVVLGIAGGETDVFVCFGLVVEEDVFDSAFGDADCDALGTHVLQLGYKGEFVERDVGADHYVGTGYDVARVSLDLDGFATDGPQFDAFLWRI
jgi:hypothetical protein